jgi:hypothetical protein
MVAGAALNASFKKSISREGAKAAKSAAGFASARGVFCLFVVIR